MNLRALESIGDELRAWSKDPPADLDFLIRHKSRQLEELAQTARVCPPEVE